MTGNAQDGYMRYGGEYFDPMISDSQQAQPLPSHQSYGYQQQTTDYMGNQADNYYQNGGVFQNNMNGMSRYLP
jgi:hypothetical protein